MPRKNTIWCLENNEAFSSQSDLAEIINADRSVVSQSLARYGKVRRLGLTFSRSVDVATAECNAGRPLFCPQTGKTYMSVRAAMTSAEVMAQGGDVTLTVLPKTMAPPLRPDGDDTGLPPCGCGGEARLECHAGGVFRVRCGRCGMTTPVVLNAPDTVVETWKNCFENNKEG